MHHPFLSVRISVFLLIYQCRCHHLELILAKTKLPQLIPIEDRVLCHKSTLHLIETQAHALLIAEGFMRPTRINSQRSSWPLRFTGSGTNGLGKFSIICGYSIAWSAFLFIFVLILAILVRSRGDNSDVPILRPLSHRVQVRPGTNQFNSCQPPLFFSPRRMNGGVVFSY